MHLVIERVVEYFASLPEPVLPAGRMGDFRPSGSLDLPGLVLSLALDGDHSSSMGRMRRDGSIVARSTRVIRAAGGADGFSADLKSVKIDPLPLKRNPGSVSQRWNSLDIGVRNMTAPQMPVEYRMVEKPLLPTEFRLNPAEAVINFGQAQKAGDLLELTHWTVTWMEDITGERYIGLLALEVWATTREQLREISGRVQDELASGGVHLRERGFLKLQPASLEAAENSRFEPTNGAALSIWRQKLSYRFRFEAELPPEITSGVPIRRIDVTFEQPNEPFSIQRT